MGHLQYPKIACMHVESREQGEKWALISMVMSRGNRVLHASIHFGNTLQSGLSWASLSSSKYAPSKLLMISISLYPLPSHFLLLNLHSFFASMNVCLKHCSTWNRIWRKTSGRSWEKSSLELVKIKGIQSLWLLTSLPCTCHGSSNVMCFQVWRM